MALRKLPFGCHLDGSGAAGRCFKKVMGLITGDDVVEACGSSQLYFRIEGAV